LILVEYQPDALLLLTMKIYIYEKNFTIYSLCISHFYSQADCATALSVCGNSNITYSPSGYGNIKELVNSGSCIDFTGEHNSIWYKITIATGGTLLLILFRIIRMPIMTGQFSARM
jgi:hypothetical protein